MNVALLALWGAYLSRRSGERSARDRTPKRSCSCRACCAAEESFAAPASTSCCMRLSLSSMSASSSTSSALFFADDALRQFVEQNGLSAYAAAILGVADSLDELVEATDEDVDELAAETGMPKLKQRKFKRALAGVRGAT